MERRAWDSVACQDMTASLFTKLCGKCRKCGDYKDYRAAYKPMGKEYGDALNERGWCRRCVDKWIAKNKA